MEPLIILKALVRIQKLQKNDRRPLEETLAVNNLLTFPFPRRTTRKWARPFHLESPEDFPATL